LVSVVFLNLDFSTIDPTSFALLVACKLYADAEISPCSIARYEALPGSVRVNLYFDSAVALSAAANAVSTSPVCIDSETCSSPAHSGRASTAAGSRSRKLKTGEVTGISISSFLLLVLIGVAAYRRRQRIDRLAPEPQNDLDGILFDTVPTIRNPIYAGRAGSSFDRSDRSDLSDFLPNAWGFPDDYIDVAEDDSEVPMTRNPLYDPTFEADDPYLELNLDAVPSSSISPAVETLTETGHPVELDQYGEHRRSPEPSGFHSQSNGDEPVARSDGEIAIIDLDAVCDEAEVAIIDLDAISDEAAVRSITGIDLDIVMPLEQESDLHETWARITGHQDADVSM
jgi:hypothetical protein